ncbi:rod-binding protein [Bosea sp. TWI1241]|jgi:flagellar protein FlgJ|uniref:rod-binding protein n=1 Tax=Bosea sp. TWI1241 TaxID=3148904 RepID=UPI00320AF075
MSPTLAIPAAKLAVGVAGGLLGKLTQAAGDERTAKARKVADDFETVFLENFTQNVMSTSGTEGPLGENGTGGEVWRSMLTQEYARNLQKAGGLGLSDQILRDLIQVQAKASGTAATGAGHAG